MQRTSKILHCTIAWQKSGSRCGLEVTVGWWSTALVGGWAKQGAEGRVCRAAVGYKTAKPMEDAMRMSLLGLAAALMVAGAPVGTKAADIKC